MDIKELESFRLSDAVKFHDELNPKLWINDKLDPKVHDTLMAMAEDFITELGIGKLKVEDITISGSNAAYSYTPHSDIDLHILVDLDKLPNDEVYRELFTSKKNEYNKTHDLTIRGIPVELYVQDSKQPHASLGEYSLLKNDWTRIPVKRRANFDQERTKAKYEKLGELIELALENKNLEDIERVLDIVKRYRKAGLQRTGEFGPENLAFKAIRKQGLFQKLWDMKQALHSRKLSLEPVHENVKFIEGTNCKNCLAWKKGSEKPVGKDELNKYGGLKPPNKEYIAMSKRVDLVTLPGKDTVKVKGFCELEDVNDWVTERMCCALWDGKGVIRDYKGQSPLMEGGAETSWSHSDEKITLQDVLELTKHIKQINLPINDNLKSKLIHWDGNPEEIERINQVTVSNQFPILVMLDSQGQIDWILDGNHRLHKAIRSQAKTIPAKLIKPGDLDDKAKRIFHIKEASGYIPSEKEKNDPRFKTALTVDVKPNSLKKNAKAFGWNISRDGRPPLLRK